MSFKTINNKKAAETLRERGRVSNNSFVIIVYVNIKIRGKMVNPKKGDQKESVSFSFASQVGECESLWFVQGPPFDQRDYMISPSESETVEGSEKSFDVLKKKLRPADIKIDCKYIVDAQRALKKISDLVKDNCVGQLTERLESLIKIFLQGSPMGFLVDDLSLVIEVVEFFSRNRSSDPKYEEFVKVIMSLASEPPKVGKASDILRFKSAITDYFTLFGELLATFDDECFQLHLLESLDCLIIRRKLVDLSCVKLSFCHEAMESSQLPCVIAALLETVPDKLYIHYLALTLQMIWVSVKAGYAMAQGNAIEFVLWRMGSFLSDTPENPSEEREEDLVDYYRLLDKSAYLVWGLFAIVSKYNVPVAAPSKKTLWSLKQIFYRELRNGTVDVRNNVAGLLAKLCAVFGEHLAWIETGLAADLAALSIATEIKITNPALQDVHWSNTMEDYVFKKIMLLCCCIFSKGQDLVPILKQQKVIDGVLKLINPKTTISWIPTQFVSLLIISFQTLSELAPKLPETYLMEKGNAKLLATIKWLSDNHFEQETLLEALKAFCTIITSNNECIIKDAKEQNCVQILIGICFCLLDVFLMKLEHQDKLSRIFLTLERLFKNDEKIQMSFCESSVSISVKLLQRILADSATDSKWNSILLVSFGGFLWEAVAWCLPSLKLFIEKNGIFLLLDFIESASFPIQMLFLGILVDMTEEGETIAHLLTWRGKNGNGILNLMIGVWQREEFMTKVPRTKDGVILDTESPIMTEEQWYLTHQVKGGHNYSPSIAEMVCSARPKVHALYQFLQKRYFVLTQVGEHNYCVQMKMTEPSYQVYIPLIEHFLALKMGEIWYEVIHDANVNGILPTAFDGEVICTLLDEKNKWASHIKTMQEEILLMRQSGDAGEETKLYNFLKSCRLTSALDALSNLDYIARTSLPKFQKQKKEKQIQDLKKSTTAATFICDEELHRTFVINTNTTFSNFESVWIKSENIREVVTEIPLVSPDSSSENRFDYADDFD